MNKFCVSGISIDFIQALFIRVSPKSLENILAKEHGLIPLISLEGLMEKNPLFSSLNGCKQVQAHASCWGWKCISVPCFMVLSMTICLAKLRRQWLKGSYNVFIIIVEMTFHYLCCIVMLRFKLLCPAHIPEKGTAHSTTTRR